VPFQNDLPNLVQGAFGGVDLEKDLLTGHDLIDHLVDRPDLAHDLIQTTVQVIAIHTFPHDRTSLIPMGVYGQYSTGPGGRQRAIMRPPPPAGRNAYADLRRAML
jgi:hypothetical protein